MRGQLKVTEAIYQQRRNRMRKLIDLDAPKVIIWFEARSLMNCFQPPTWRERWHEWQMKNAPHWLLMLINSEYREMAKDEDTI